MPLLVDNLFLTDLSFVCSKEDSIRRLEVELQQERSMADNLVADMVKLQGRVQYLATRGAPGPSRGVGNSILTTSAQNGDTVLYLPDDTIIEASLQRSSLYQLIPLVPWFPAGSCPLKPVLFLPQPDEMRTRYLRLKETNEHLLRKLESSQQELDHLNVKKRELDDELNTSPVKQEAGACVCVCVY